LSFIIPGFFFELSIAIILSVIFGLFILGLISFVFAKKQKAKPWKVITEHLAIALIVIAITHCVGDWVSSIFG